MNSFDDIFEGHVSQRGQTNQPFDKEAWAEKKQAERQSVYDLADTTAVEVSTDGSKFQSYLDVQTRFSRYSATNVLLILAQKPEATQLKDFNGWKEAGASIKRQQKGISILEPGEEYERADGSIGTSYNVKRVFDISQTTARAKVQPAISVDDRLLLKALISRSPVPMQTVDDLPNHMGALYDHDQQVIFVRRGMDAADIFRSVSKELAHAEIAGMERIIPAKVQLLLHTVFPICSARSTKWTPVVMISVACRMFSGERCAGCPCYLVGNPGCGCKHFWPYDPRTGAEPSTESERTGAITWKKKKSESLHWTDMSMALWSMRLMNCEMTFWRNSGPRILWMRCS